MPTPKLLSGMAQGLQKSSPRFIILILLKKDIFKDFLFPNLDCK